MDINTPPKRKDFVNLVGRAFGKYKVIGYHMKKNGQHRFMCQCECGALRSVISQSLKDGKSKSCGCLHKNRIAEITRTHGLSSASEYIVWTGIKARCNNPKSKSYKNYGGRGIAMCERWDESFESFLADMGKRPSSRHSIERIDNNGNYSPENCKWKTRRDQSNNTRRCLMINWNGKTQSATMWAREIGVHPAMIQQRINKLKWPVDKAMTTPKLRTK